MCICSAPTRPTGPHQGIMVIREDWGMELPNQGHHFNGDSLYKRFTPAGPDHAQVAASAGMADYFDALSVHHGGGTGAAAARKSHDLMRAQEVALLQPLLDYVSAKNSVRLDRSCGRFAPCAHCRHGTGSGCRRDSGETRPARYHGGGRRFLRATPVGSGGCGPRQRRAAASVSCITPPRMRLTR